MKKPKKTAKWIQKAQAVKAKAKKPGRTNKYA